MLSSSGAGGLEIVQIAKAMASLTAKLPGKSRFGAVSPQPGQPCVCYMYVYIYIYIYREREI